VPSSYLQQLARPFERPLRILHWRHAWNDISVSTDCLEATDRVASLLISAGHEVREVAPTDLDYAAFIDAHIDVLSANIVSSVNGIVGRRPAEEWARLLEPAILDGYRLGRSLTAEKYIQAINLFHSVGRRLTRQMSGWDFVLTPTLTTPPVALGVISTDTDFRSFRNKVATYTTFLAVTNASGHPSASLPTHWNADGLPIGIQLIGHFGAEADLLRLSAYLESEMPWAQRKPKI
jgi:amidase